MNRKKDNGEGKGGEGRGGERENKEARGGGGAEKGINPLEMKLCAVVNCLP